MIPFVDLKAQYRTIRAEIQEEIGRVLDSSAYVLGPAVVEFEASFARYCQAAHAVAVNSGTSALHLALLEAGVGPGDEVITVPMTFVATVATIEYVGARPVYVDVTPDTWTMDPERLEGAITSCTRAIVPVHLHGLPADMDRIDAIARRHGLMIIEDAAQAHGAEIDGRRAGSLGDIAGFSFYPGKNLGAYGEGGAVVTEDDARAERLRRLRDWGQTRKYRHEFKGFNYRMDGIQGAVLGVKLRHLEAWTEARRSLASLYDRLLDEIGIGRPMPPPGYRHVYHIYAVRLAERDRALRHLTEAGIDTSIHYPVPVHLQPAYADPAYPLGSMPVSEQLAAEFLSLPMYPELELRQLEQVVESLAGFIAPGRHVRHAG